MSHITDKCAEYEIDHIISEAHNSLWRQTTHVKSATNFFTSRRNEKLSLKSIDVNYYSYKSPFTHTAYEGEWDELGMTGKGKISFENDSADIDLGGPEIDFCRTIQNNAGEEGVEDFSIVVGSVVYIGGMRDNLFDGAGRMYLPSGTYIDGKWSNGKLKDYKIYFKDGLEYSDTNWTYCKQPDRRFRYEMIHGLNPAGNSIQTNEQPAKIIPEGHYDTVDGFYDPKRQAVLDYKNLSKIIRVPKDHDWIKKNCRKAWDEPVGPRPDIYESWWPY